MSVFTQKKSLSLCHSEYSGRPTTFEWPKPLNKFFLQIFSASTTLLLLLFCYSFHKPDLYGDVSPIFCWIILIFWLRCSSVWCSLPVRRPPVVGLTSFSLTSFKSKRLFSFDLLSFACRPDWTFQPTIALRVNNRTALAANSQSGAFTNLD